MKPRDKSQDKPGDKPEDSPEARRRAIELLEGHHAFPCSFSLSVIARTDDAVEAALLAAAAAGLGQPLGKDAHHRRPSTHGKYVSHRLSVPCGSAEAVLDLFARLRAVEGVITIL